MNTQFKQNHTLEQRKEFLKQQEAKFPSHILVIAERHRNCKFQDLGKVKYLVRKELPIITLKTQIKASLQFKEHDALFMYCGKTMINEYEKMESLYQKYKDSDDGLLYVEYSETNPFG